MKRLLVLALLCAPVAARAGRLPLRVVAPGAVHVALYRADAPAPPVERDVQPGEIAIDLSDGAWRLEANAAGLWHKRQYVTVPSASAVEVRLWPAAAISGEAAFADPKSSAEQLTVRFDVRDGPSGDEQCAIAAKRFSCTIPAGTADVALRVRGHITQYVWGAALAPGSTRDLGRLTFVRGATLAGRVEPPRGVRMDLDQVVVTASPAAEGASGGLTSLSARPNAKGFFHLDGIAPGKYEVVAAARRPRMSSPPATAVVIANAEATLNRPLAMSITRAVTIDVTPPLDPWGKQWRVAIVRITPSERIPLADALVAINGSYETEPLHAGRYDVEIGAQDNSIWHDEEIEVDDSTSTLLVPLQLTRLRGKVRLGDKPLAAKIWVGGEYGAPRIVMHSGEDGEFEGFVPRRENDVWRVTVQSEAPAAKRNINAVRLRRRDDGDLEADLRLDVTLLQGEVVDEKGNPVPRAGLNVVAAAGEPDNEFVQPNRLLN